MFFQGPFRALFSVPIENKLTRINPRHQKTDSTAEEFSWKTFFSARWKRLLVLLVGFVLFLILISFVGRTIFAVLFTILPLFFGYGISFLLAPLIHFFSPWIGQRAARWIVFFLFMIIVLGLVIGFIFILVFQFDDLYQQFLNGSGSKDFENKFIARVNRGEKISNLQFYKIPDVDGQKIFQLTFLDANEQKVMISTSVTQTADVYIFLLKIISFAPYLQRVLFSGIAWLHKSIDNYAWLNFILQDIWLWLSFFYLIFFTLIVAGFTLDDKGNFYRRLWNFLTKGQDPKTSAFLKTELKTAFSSWFKALLLVQTYILVGTALFVFVAGILFSWSTYQKSVFVLAFFMFLCNFVPYIGPTVGIIPIIGIGIVDAIKQGGDHINHWLPMIIAAGGCLLVQLGESALVSPLVYSYKMKLRPITIIFAIALFGVVFGVLSMPFAIPILIFSKIIAKVVYKKEWNI